MGEGVVALMYRSSKKCGSLERFKRRSRCDHWSKAKPRTSMVAQSVSRPMTERGPYTARKRSRRLFERSVLLAVPSCLTEKDEQDIIDAFEKVLDSHHG